MILYNAFITTIHDNEKKNRIPYHFLVHSTVSSWKEAAKWNFDALFPARWSLFQTDVMITALVLDNSSQKRLVNQKYIVGIAVSLRLPPELQGWQLRAPPPHSHALQPSKWRHAQTDLRKHNQLTYPPLRWRVAGTTETLGHQLLYSVVYPNAILWKIALLL